MTQEEAFRALQAIHAHVFTERKIALEHLTGDRLWAHVLTLDPGVGGTEFVKGFVEEIAERFGMLNRIELAHTLLIRNALGLHRGDFSSLILSICGAGSSWGLRQWIRKASAHSMETRRIRIEPRKCIQKKKRQGLMERKVLLQLHVHKDFTTRRRRWHQFDNLAFEECPKKLPCPASQLALAMRRGVRIAYQLF